MKMNFKTTVTFDKSTPGKHRYQSAILSNGVPIIELYIQSSAFEDPEPPRQITVTMQWQ